ncbi:MAG TPA: glycosyltransferase family 2 protein [Planctomycetota bacterium]|nr:glycosyltransferase family 2 protein [Planctomycetota bacterium]
MKTLTVICSVHNEELTIPLFFARLAAVFAQLGGRYRTQLFFVDNGCTDRSLELIRGLADAQPWVYVWVLSRNFGYQCAVDAGLRHSPGDLFVVIDVDCEDPPEMIPEFLAQHEDGYDIVYGERVDRPENALLKAGRKLFYRVIRSVADDNFVLDMAEFSLITAEVRDAIVQDTNSFPFVRASIGRIGFRRKAIPYKRQHRVAGRTHYNFLGLLLFAIAGILSASTFPLRVATYLFPLLVLAMIALVMAGAVWSLSWTTPALCALGFAYCGYVLAATALYVARIYKNGLLRPNVILRPQLCRLPAELAIALPGGERNWVMPAQPPAARPTVAPPAAVPAAASKQP